jgi:hypothetical protein
LLLRCRAHHLNALAKHLRLHLQTAQGTGNHWLHERMPDVESHPAWISTMADDIALVTSFWR